MRNLTEEEIKDLESRGIKPGVLLRCSNDWSDDVHFCFQQWDEFAVESDGDISSKKPGFSVYYVWLKCGEDYATPVEQPQLDNTVRPVSDGLLQPDYGPMPKQIKTANTSETITMHGPQYPPPIDWEARRWELATRMFIKETYAGPRHIEKAISNADAFIHEYRNTPMP